MLIIAVANLIVSEFPLKLHANFIVVPEERLLVIFLVKNSST